MSQNLRIGARGEEIAQSYLLKNSFDILETNWRFQKAEVDIIAKDKDVLVFIEVKTRSTKKWGNPEDSISPKKQSLIADAASQYMNLINHEWEIRFDVISIILNEDDSYQIKHFPDAYFPGW